MTKDEAQQIVDAWAFYLEQWQHKIFVLFGGSAPESLLPASVVDIEEAVNIIAESYYYQRNFEEAELLHRSFGWLSSYCDDDLALLQARDHFANSEFRSLIVSRLREFPRIEIAGSH